MNLRTFIISVVALIATVFCVSCGGGGGGDAAAKGIQLSIKWPAKGRYIPAYADDIKLDLQSDSNPSTVLSTVATRPSDKPNTQTISMTGNIPAGNYTLTASARMTLQDGHPVVATAKKGVVIAADKVTTVTIDLVSTLNSLEIDPTRIAVGETKDLSATGFLDNEDIIPLAGQYLLWSIGGGLPNRLGTRGGAPNFQGDGNLSSDGTFEGTLSGPVNNVTALEQGANVLGSGTIYVYDLLATSSWPNLRGDLGCTGQSAISAGGSKGQDWSDNFDTSMYGAPVIASDGTVLVTIGSGDLVAKTASGGNRWTFSVSNQFLGSPTVGKDGTIFVVESNGVLHAVSLGDGSERWSASMQTSSSATPNIAPNGYVVVGDDGGKLYAFDTATGLEKWTYTSAGPIISCPAIGNGLVYGTTTLSQGTQRAHPLGGQPAPAERAFAVNMDTGAQVWSTPVALPGGPALSVDGSSLFVATPQALVQLDAATGASLGSTALGGSGYSTPAIGRNGLVFTVTDNSTRVVAINPSTKQIIWVFPTAGGASHPGREISFFPEGQALVDLNGDVVVGVGSGVYCLNKADGSIKWQIGLEDGVFQSPALGSTGEVYFIGFFSGTLYAYVSES